MNQEGPTLEHHLDPTNKREWTISKKLDDKPSFQKPIIKFIEYNMVLIDDLHLLLRVTDKLLKLLLLKFIRLDQNEGKEISKRKNLEIFINFLIDKLARDK